MTGIMVVMQINDELPHGVEMHAPLKGAKAIPSPLGVDF